MSTTMAPPPLPTTPPPGPPPARGGQAGLVVAILVAVLGGLIILGTVASTAFTTIVSSRVVSDRLTSSVAGVTELQVEAAASRLTISFDDVDEAVLDTTGQRGGWTLASRGSTLEVRSPDGPFFSWWADPGIATLTLPEELDGRLDASFTIGAGELRASGAFGDLDLSVNAGSLTVEGSARTVAVDVGAGRANVWLADVREIGMDVNAGSINAGFTGRLPDQVTANVSAGSIEASFPRGVYNVQSQVEVGRFNNQLQTSTSSDRSVSVEVSAGGVTFREAN